MKMEHLAQLELKDLLDQQALEEKEDVMDLLDLQV